MLARAELQIRRDEVFPCLHLFSLTCLCSSRLFVARRGLYHRRSHAKTRSWWPSQEGERLAPCTADRSPCFPKHRSSPQNARDQPGLLDRILDTPHLARVVPQLPPELLHRVIQTYGLEDCGDLVALATPAQLQQVFDVDLWRPLRPGLDEQLDVDRFGVWLDVLMGSGAAIAAEKIVGMDVHLVIAALAQHVLVFDRAAVSPLESPEGDEAIERPSKNNALVCDVGGYRVEAKRSDAWDPIVSLLLTPRFGSSRLLPSRDARLPEPFELRIRA